MSGFSSFDVELLVSEVTIVEVKPHYQTMPNHTKPLAQDEVIAFHSYKTCFPTHSRNFERNKNCEAVSASDQYLYNYRVFNMGGYTTVHSTS